MSGVDLKKELLAARKKSGTTNVLLEVGRILRENGIRRNEIRERLANGLQAEAAFEFDLLESDCIFHISQIRNVCIDYRLRFLDSACFNHAIPEEAVSKIRILEDLHQTKISGFKIAAPSKAFKLKNYDDPLLFAPLGNEYYYLIHKWGNDLSKLRKWAVLPVKSLGSFIALCLIVSFLVTYFTPDNALSRSVPMAPVIIFLFAFKSIVAVFMYSYFLLGKRFNDGIWDSEYFNN